MTIHVLSLSDYPIQKQLALEEFLLRNTEKNWCLINKGSSPAIVMGISGKQEELVCPNRLAKAPLPVIRRFSGGGTVIVDEHTLFITFICQNDLHSFRPYPEPIMRWTEEVYREVFAHPGFSLRENDYVLFEKKCGGNAQYLKKNRWLHHTSFLWDFEPAKMAYLLHPKKTPSYREGRTHTDFLCTLKEHFDSQEVFEKRLIAALAKQFMIVNQEDLIVD